MAGEKLSEYLEDLRVSYTPSTDTLVLAAGPVLGSNGETVARNLVAFHNEEGDEVVGVVIEHATETLLPVLEEMLRRRAEV